MSNHKLYTGLDIKKLEFDAVLVIYDSFLKKKANDYSDNKNPFTNYDDLYSLGLNTLHYCYKSNKTKDIKNFSGYLSSSLHNRVLNLKLKEVCKKRKADLVSIDDLGSESWEPICTATTDLRSNQKHCDLVDNIRATLNGKDSKIFEYIIEPKPRRSLKFKSNTITIEEIQTYFKLPEWRIQKALETIRNKTKEVMREGYKENINDLRGNCKFTQQEFHLV